MNGAFEKVIGHIPKLVSIPQEVFKSTLGTIKEHEPLLKGFLQDGPILGSSLRRNSRTRCDDEPIVSKAAPAGCQNHPVVCKCPTKCENDPIVSQPLESENPADCNDKLITRRRRDADKVLPEINIFKRFHRDTNSSKHKIDNLVVDKSTKVKREKSDKMEASGDSDILRESIAEFVAFPKHSLITNTASKIPSKMNGISKKSNNKALSRFKRFVYGVRIPDTEVLNLEPFVEHTNAKYHHDYEDIKDFETYNLQSNYIIEKLDKPLHLCANCGDFVRNTDNIEHNGSEKVNSPDTTAMSNSNSKYITK